MGSERLTGRTRYRETLLLKRLVLQVERVRYWECDQGYMPIRDWRDARAEDFCTPTERKFFSRKPPIPFPGQRLPDINSQKWEEPTPPQENDR